MWTQIPRDDLPKQSSSQETAKKPSKAWETKAGILKDGDLHNMTYDELRGNLLTYEQNHINRYNEEKKKPIVPSVVWWALEKTKNIMKEWMALIYCELG